MEMQIEEPQESEEVSVPEAPVLPKSKASANHWGWDILLLLALIVGAYFRLTGTAWDEGQYLHPDERFLAMVGSSIEPVQQPGEYFDTAVSSLNPNNRGHGFFVYGTLPIFIERYVGQALDLTGYGDVAKVGRPLSGIFDLATIFVMYLLVSTLYDKRVAFLAASFSSFAVLQIQLSHFFTVDIFLTFFIWLSLYFGVKLAVQQRPLPLFTKGANEWGKLLGGVVSHEAFWWTLLFGLAFGMALASKVSAYPLALALPVAGAMYLSRQDEEARTSAGGILFLIMVLAGIVSLLTFRVFQPYAFTGPGFFGLAPNEIYIETLGRLRQLLEPAVGYPPSVQWFNRSIFFSGKNITLWGLGLPLGLTAWAGLIWMGWRVFRGEWNKHLILWLWVAGYFVWQSFAHNPTMRYQLPIYPGLAVMAAWFIVGLWDKAWVPKEMQPNQESPWRLAGVIIGSVVFITTFFYAYAFSQIYTREVTRLEASRWFYQNIPGAINVQISDGAGFYNQPVPFHKGFLIEKNRSFTTSFKAKAGGIIETVQLHEVIPAESTNPEETSLFITIMESEEDQTPLGMATIKGPFPDDFDNDYTIQLSQPVFLASEETYYLRVDVIGGDHPLNICEPIILLMDAISSQQPPVVATETCTISYQEPYLAAFNVPENGMVSAIVAPQIEEVVPQQDIVTINLAVVDPANDEEVLATASLIYDPAIHETATFPRPTFVLDNPVPIAQDQELLLRFSLGEGADAIAFKGSGIALESSWDDAIPYRVDGYDGYGGIYTGDLNLEMYWEDNEDKRQRFGDILDNADVLAISSSRQWASVGRLKEVFPLSHDFYRNLMGCPANKDLEWCYSVAEVGMFQGRLGYELAVTFQSNPNLGGFSLNDQFSEEAFTVYDHPKVLIFVKAQDYDSAQVRQILADAPLPAGDADPEGSNEPLKSLLLEGENLVAQQEGGTWSEIFNRDSLLNRSPWIGVVIWYLAVFVIGLVAFPIVRYLMPGLKGQGYALSRTAGVLLLSYIVWLLGSLGVPFEKLTISLVFLLLAIIGGGLALRGRQSLKEFWQANKRYVLTIEMLALAMFVFFLLIRLGNPDLWHPWKGGEKPMDFAYFNAVLRSTTFPPYDPWFAGGYINYYYYGFVFVGVLVKWLGIIPSIAYNFILPTLFMLVGLGAFSIAWNLMHAESIQTLLRKKKRELATVDEEALPVVVEEVPQVDAEQTRVAYLAGFLATLGVAVAGNLGTIKMVWIGYQKLGAPSYEAVEGSAFFLTKWFWVFTGFFKSLGVETKLPYAMPDWYWNPSRSIPAPGEVEPITEFPFFTFLYADLHAHMIALPLAILALAWAVSLVMGKAWAREKGRSLLQIVLSIAFGALTIGVLRPTNTWDYPTYLGLGVVALLFALTRYLDFEKLRHGWLQPILNVISPKLLAFFLGLLGAGLLVSLSTLFFKPYVDAYALGYTEIITWKGSHTGSEAYLTHWGAFLFVIVSWLLWETRDWLANTSAARAVKSFRDFREFYFASIFLILIWIGALLYFDIAIGWFVLPIGLWTTLLLFRRDQSDIKRTILFLVGTNIFLSLMVEIIVLSGDIGRMNTVFKFYLQGWVLFAISAAVCVGWLLLSLPQWNKLWRTSWQIVAIALLFFVSLYPLFGGFAKIKDRMAEEAPASLDGTAYMPYAKYFDQDTEIHFNEDYEAITWLQDNVVGSPTIVEAQTVEYRWGSRISINTGLPTVLGWNWHQRQQRTGHDQAVWARATDIADFYQATDFDLTQSFLTEYGVEYIILGRLEQAYYAGPGMNKFLAFDGVLWEEVFRSGETVIYKVIEL